jgi:hypothetical protein
MAERGLWALKLVFFENKKIRAATSFCDWMEFGGSFQVFVAML